MRNDGIVKLLAIVRLHDGRDAKVTAEPVQVIPDLLGTLGFERVQPGETGGNINDKQGVVEPIRRRVACERSIAR